MPAERRDATPHHGADMVNGAQPPAMRTLA